MTSQTRREGKAEGSSPLTIRPQGQGHLFRQDLPAEIDFAPGILPGADAPALKGPFPVIRVEAQAVNHIPGSEDGLVPGFHIGGAVGIKIHVPPQIQRIPRQIPGQRELFRRHEPG